MKKTYISLFLLSLFILCSSCNDEWTDELYENFVSFKAPLINEGITNIYVRYKGEGKTTFQQPLIVSGSTTNSKDLSVSIAVDPDTLQTLNFERFQNREDFYYRQLSATYFTIPSQIGIKSGENTALMPIDFTFKDIDMTEKWVLPLTILDDPSGNYNSHPRKHYRKALLRVNPFNNYSGTYSGTALKTNMKGYEDETPIVKSEIRSYVVDENTIFFYAGNIDEDRQDRRNYKVYATFNQTGGVRFWSDNPEMDFKLNKDASYTIAEQMDAVRPYLLHRYITINNIDYEFTDYTMISTVDINYVVTGSVTLHRQLNTQIPDEDQAILW
ncbi:DUF4973 domain-containing protein [Sphingobacterium alkalisoli]|uniref:DUF4973 domain-containing protein n=1 Tax=Sphingobacterium alkalisoli TaxID=1874115 RepID=A0A4V5LYY6_9SPHI|nr:DUF4973 domain-containing protein [Sphingobacterium alkalisoli]TJY68209.1 DUF4973 domain-containing protein [Sphingobacterium alkalisoli]GGH08226.1 hypothetical protein GCM10011418_05610 [Sphingobacterium alkalisoli]